MDVKGCDLCKTIFTYRPADGVDVIDSGKRVPESFRPPERSVTREICPSCNERFHIWIVNQTK